MGNGLSFDYRRYRPFQSPSAYSSGPYTSPTNFFSILWEETTMPSFDDTNLTSVVTRLRCARKLKLTLSLPRKRYPPPPLRPATSPFFNVLCRTPCLCSRGRLQPLTLTSYPYPRTAPQGQSPSRSGARFPAGFGDGISAGSGRIRREIQHKIASLLLAPRSDSSISGIVPLEFDEEEQHEGSSACGGRPETVV